MTALLTRSRRLLLVLVVAVGLSVAIGSSTPASAAQESDASQRARNYYGAISIASNQAWGVSYDYATKKKAIKRARAECLQHASKCVTAVWVRNGCAAVSVHLRQGSVDGYGWAVERTKRQAVKRAQAKCRSSFGKCKKLTWVCTTRP